MTAKNVGDGKVYLIASPGKGHIDIAARFTSSERSVEDIIGSEYNKNIVKNILKRGHLAATEFDYWVFGVEGYSRVCETQLVRKRMASYLIKSGRSELKGKREFSTVAPKQIYNTEVKITYPQETAYMNIDNVEAYGDVTIRLTGEDICNIIEQWYDQNLEKGFKEEDLRYLKPQATEFKAIIGMNSHALLDWFKIRCCFKAQTEIRDLATKMLSICKEVQPDVFQNAGASCVSLGFCPENDNQCEQRKGTIITLDNAKKIVAQAK